MMCLFAFFWLSFWSHAAAHVGTFTVVDDSITSLDTECAPVTAILSDSYGNDIPLLHKCVHAYMC